MFTRLGVITCLVSSVFLFCASLAIANHDMSDSRCQVLEESYCKARNQYVYKCEHEYSTIYLYRSRDDFNVGDTLRISEGYLGNMQSDGTRVFTAFVMISQVVVVGICLGWLANYTDTDRYGFMRAYYYLR